MEIVITCLNNRLAESRITRNTLRAYLYNGSTDLENSNDACCDANRIRHPKQGIQVDAELVAQGMYYNADCDADVHRC